MVASKVLKVRVLGSSSIPNTRWCEPVDWEPKNEFAGSSYAEGAWWDDHEATAGLVWLGHGRKPNAGEILEVSPEELKVVSCGECRILGEVQL
jgi:hypothetical protein